ncbi:hypothetical protein GTU79_03425 [Sodalis ligni]|uniref:hypothetical protein n=1 Tax=Sodalis ligni TaxID=2697027 RepID=UPI00193F6C0C|nr:hypothetical protein [Sodalis ligni]QWA11861.1 hypothetical protein GTU79_03425 [Sodalis ligni]
MSFSVNPPPKQYLYNSLIIKEGEPEHILAYALYKVHKNKVINQARHELWSGSQLALQLKSLHDSVIQQEGMRQHFYQQAREMSEKFVTETKERIKRDAVSEYQEKVAQYRRIITPPWVKFVKWLGVGLSGLIASVVVIVMLTGFSALFLGKEGRTQIAVAAGKTIFKILNSDIPVADHLTVDKHK